MYVAVVPNRNLTESKHEFLGSLIFGLRKIRAWSDTAVSAYPNDADLPA
jgi:hypothetical protein